MRGPTGGRDDASLPRKISELVALAQNDDACRVLGVDGVLEGQLDVEFLDDPLDWIAYDIATAFRAHEDQAAPIMLTTLVAELRLLRAMRGQIDEIALQRLVRQYLDEAANSS